MNPACAGRARVIPGKHLIEIIAADAITYQWSATIRTIPNFHSKSVADLIIEVQADSLTQH